MAGLEKVSKGDRLKVKADTWNTFVDVANYVRQRMMNQGGSADRMPDDATPFKNTASSDMPQYGVGWLTNAAFQGLSVVQQPSYPCISRIIIASKPSAAGALGAGWTYGLRPVRVTNWNSITVGQRIGAQLGSWLAGADPLGPMLVIGKLDSPLVVVLITGQRGGTKMIRTGSGATAGRPVKVLVFSSRFTLTQTAPGDVTVSGG
jgi:hypothetical protein